MAQAVERPMTERASNAQTVKATSKPTSTRADGEVSRLAIFLHAVAFVFGFGFVFTLLGLTSSLIGQFLLDNSFTIQRVGAILLLIFGLTTLGVFRWLVGEIRKRTDLATNPAAAALVKVLDFFNTLLYTEKRVTEMHNVKRGLGYASSALMGVSFSAGWVPCIGPILSSILFLASTETTAAQGALLLAIYSLGLGIPFLLTGAAFSTATKVLRWLNRYAGVVSLLSGIFLLYVAYLLWFGQLGALAGQFSGLNDVVYNLEIWVSSALGIENAFGLDGMALVSAAPLALIAGLISFISPCVLPLVPAYIGYLSGASLSTNR